MRPEDFRVLAADEKSVRGDYEFDGAALALLVRARGHARSFVVLRSSREKVETFVAARYLESKGLIRLALSTDIDGEQSRVYRLTERGEEVARVVGAS